MANSSTTHGMPGQDRAGVPSPHAAAMHSGCTSPSPPTADTATRLGSRPQPNHLHQAAAASLPAVSLLGCHKGHLCNGVGQTQARLSRVLYLPACYC